MKNEELNINMVDNISMFQNLNEDFLESKNILKYKLSLEFNRSKNTIDEDKIIDAIYSEKIEYNNKFMLKLETIFSKKAYEHLNLELNLDEREVKRCIKNHIIISTLYTAKYLLLKEKNITIYDLGDFATECGYWTLKSSIDKLYGVTTNDNKNENDYYNKFKIVKKYWKPVKQIEKRNFIKKFNSFCENDNYKYIVDSLTSKDSSNICLYDSDYTYCVMNCIRMVENAENKDNPFKASAPIKLNNHIKRIKKTRSYRDCKTFGKQFILYCTNIIEEYSMPIVFENYKSTDGIELGEKELIEVDSADKVLFYYRFERNFNFELLKTIYKYYENNIKEMSNLGSAIKLLEFMTFLPNCFSRSYFINNILEVIGKGELPIRENTGSVKPPMENVYKPDEMTNENNIMQLFKKFIIHFSGVTIPIYERYFFILLYEYCEGIYGKDKCLENMTELLHKYVCNNEDDLMTVFSSNGKLNNNFNYENENYENRNREKISLDQDGNISMKDIRKIEEFYSELLIKLYDTNRVSDFEANKFKNSNFNNINEDEASKIYIKNAVNNISDLIKNS